MNTSSQYYFDTPDEERAFLVLDLASLYIFNLLVVADETDEGGLDHPLPASHACLQPMINSLMERELIQVEPYDEGEEYVPSSKAKSFISELISETEKYRHLSAEGLDQVKKAFFMAMDQGNIKHIDESIRPWYESITRFDFYEALTPPPQASKLQSSKSMSSSTMSEDSAIKINKKPEHFENKSYLYKKPTILGLIVTVIVVIITQSFSSSLLYIPLFLAVAWTIYYGAMKTSVGSEGIEHKTLLGTTNIEIEDIQELVYKEDDGNADSFQVIGNQGDSITVSTWVDDFTGLRKYLETIKDDQVQS